MAAAQLLLAATLSAAGSSAAGRHGGVSNCAARDCFSLRLSPPQIPPASPTPLLLGIPDQIPLVMEPPQLAFEPWPLCVPEIGSVEMINTSEDEELTVYQVAQASIAGSDFHVLPFNLTTLPPLGNLSFSVVFLPGALGSVNGSLLIQTSAGGFFYGFTDNFNTRPELHERTLTENL